MTVRSLRGQECTRCELLQLGVNLSLTHLQRNLGTHVQKKHSSNRNCGSHAWFVWPADTTNRVMPIRASRHKPVSIVNKTKVTVRSLRDKKST